MKKGEKHASRNPGGQDLSGDKAQDGRQGQSGADRAGADGAITGDGQAADVEKTEGAQGTGAQAGKPAYLTVTETSMQDALKEARGDIFVASQLLGITAIRLNRAIQVSSVLQATMSAIATAEKGISAEALDDAIAQRLRVYRVVGLDALHDLATMPIDENSAQNQVKLAAAARLAGEAGGGATGGEMGEALRELNQLYHEHAPRLRVVRERVTVEVSPSAPEPEAVQTIEGESQRTQ
jgi:hypothetical protein